MKPAPFDYLAPTTVEETLMVLREHGEDAKVLAGGQSLVPILNFRLARPAVLVDINRVTELDGMEVRDGELCIGAMTRQQAVETRLPAPTSSDGSPGSIAARPEPTESEHRSGERARSGATAEATGVLERAADRSAESGLTPPSAEAWGLLGEAAGYIGHRQVRTRGTLGGSLAHADPAAELPAAVSALGATLLVQSAAGSREVAPEDFFEGFFTTSLSADELLTGIRVPAWPDQTRTSFQEVSRRRGDFAMVAVAAVVTVSQDVVTRAGVAVAGAAPRTVQARSVTDGLVGREPDARTISELAGDFAADLDPPPDNHGPAEYRRHLARRLVERALTEATQLAGAGTTA